VTFTINAVSLDETGTLDILVVEDPGSPIGLTAQPTSTQCAAGVSACRTVTYTPRKVCVHVFGAGMGKGLGIRVLESWSKVVRLRICPGCFCCT
jgi:hypothetical protein